MLNILTAVGLTEMRFGPDLQAELLKIIKFEKGHGHVIKLNYSLDMNMLTQSL